MQEIAGALGRHRLAKHKALSVFAPELIKLDSVGVGFSTLGDHIHAEIVSQRDDRTQDHRPRAFRRCAHEGLIDLDRVEWESLQISKRGIAGAEIVEREPGAEFANPLQHLRGVFGILHHD